MKSILTLSALVVLAAGSSSAAVLLNETFSYPSGGIVANSGGVWTNSSGTGALIQVNAGGEVAGLVHGGGSREDVTTTFTATPIATSNNAFSSFSFTVNTAPTAGSDYFFGLHEAAGTNFRGRVFLSAPTASGFRIGISNSTAAASFTFDLVVGQTYYAVVRTSNTTGTNSAIWIGTSLSSIAGVGEASPTATASDALGSLVAFSRVIIRQGSSITVANSLNFDNLVIGNTFADVAPIPEPSAYAALVGVATLGGMSLVRRRRTRAV